MRSVDWSHSALLARFADFYAEVARCREAIQKGSLASLFEGQMQAQPSPDDLAILVSRRLLRHLEYQLRDVKAEGSSEEQSNYRRALYVMAALADEIFLLDLVWPGSEPWLRHLLEQSLFRSRQAGHVFFQQIEDLLRTQGGPQRELAAIFLLALQLGFKGENRGRGGQQALAHYRKRLIGFIGADRPEGAEWRPPFAQAYGYTLFEYADQRLAPLKPWCRVAAVALAGYLLVSCALWFSFLLPATLHLQHLIGPRS
jgi:type VI secretion system protein ImpK